MMTARPVSRYPDRLLSLDVLAPRGTHTKSASCGPGEGATEPRVQVSRQGGRQLGDPQEIGLPKRAYPSRPVRFFQHATDPRI